MITAGLVKYFLNIRTGWGCMPQPVLGSTVSIQAERFWGKFSARGVLSRTIFPPSEQWHSMTMMVIGQAGIKISLYACRLFPRTSLWECVEVLCSPQRRAVLRGGILSQSEALLYCQGERKARTKSNWINLLSTCGTYSEQAPSSYRHSKSSFSPM